MLVELVCLNESQETDLLVLCLAHLLSLTKDRGELLGRDLAFRHRTPLKRKRRVHRAHKWEIEML